MMRDAAITSGHGPALVSPLSATLGFSAVITDIAQDAPRRELEHRLPYEEIAQLKALGFGALRVPTDNGGHDVSLSELFVVARDIAAADSNIAHAFRRWKRRCAIASTLSTRTCCV